MSTARRDDTAAALAAHRFGLAEPTLAAVGGDPQAWLLAQIGPAEPQRGHGLVTSVEGLQRFAAHQAGRRKPQASVTGTTGAAGAASGDTMGRDPTPGGAPPAMAGVDPNPAQQPFGDEFRALLQADLRARLTTAATSTRPFNERLALFWANHFSVSMVKNGARGITGAFEREAIRPHIGGRFVDLLQAVVHHPAMLRYLDNDNSAGPDSALVRRRARNARPGEAPRITGLNENLAREVLELHTLGVSGGGAAYGGWGGYTQADVTAFARVLTGWRVPMGALAGLPPEASATQFDPAWHQPGPKTVLNKRYAEGPAALDAVLADLAQHPSTARFIASKLARHFVADDPAPALVARLARAFADSGGDLPTLVRTLVQSPEAWQAQPAKLKTPEEFVLSAVRVLQIGDAAFARQPDGGIGQLGQRVHAAPSPAGWPDRAEEWLGPDAVWKRIEWATRVADRLGRRIDARALAQASLGPLLQDNTRQQIDRAADGPQALALLLMAPEFQRR